MPSEEGTVLYEVDIDVEHFSEWSITSEVAESHGARAARCKQHWQQDSRCHPCDGSHRICGHDSNNQSGMQQVGQHNRALSTKKDQQIDCGNRARGGARRLARKTSCTTQAGVGSSGHQHCVLHSVMQIKFKVGKLMTDEFNSNLPDNAQDGIS